MKTLLFVFSIMIVLSACHMENEKEYKDMAQEVCGCVNDATEGLSDEGRKVIIAAGENGTDIVQDRLEYAQKDPVQAMQDHLVLGSLGDIESMDCVQAVEKKYEDVFADETDDEKIEKLIKVMKDIDDCKLTYAMFKAAFDMKKK